MEKNVIKASIVKYQWWNLGSRYVSVYYKTEISHNKMSGESIV